VLDGATRVGKALLALGLVLAPFSFSLAAVTIEKGPTELSVRTSFYQASIANEGFQITLRRGTEIVLQSAGPADSYPNLGFVAHGAQQHLTKLSSFHQSGSMATLEYDTTVSGVTARVEIQAEEDQLHFRTWLLCSDNTYAPSLRYHLDSYGLWYGGGFQGYREPHAYPLNNAKITPRMFFAQGASQGTPIWYSTKGVAIWVTTFHDFNYSINDLVSGRPNGLLDVEMPGVSSLSYDILIAPDVREVLRRINRKLGFPQTVPPGDYFRLPIYTTWVENKTAVSQEKVLEFARAIRAHHLPAGVIEIDDKWEDGYGDLRFNLTKFPAPKAMNEELHRLGFRVTLWVHPFVNVGTQSFSDPKIQPLLMKDLSGKPGLIKWWQGDAATWDLTNPQASAEFRRRLQQLQDRYGFDGFKFDGGDVHLVPIDLLPFHPIRPANFPDVYNREATSHFPWSETRVGIYSQPVGVVQRLIDKQSVWGNDNGLGAVVPEAIMTSLRGFTYVMPDMVGGNQYDGDTIDKELLVRWAQASALMPLLQFSWGPWHFDEETVRLCREASALHTKFSPYIIKLANAAPRTGEPILRPLWYNFPGDQTAQAITDQYMVGDALLVAPVLEKGARSRKVYLPEGRWRDYRSGKVFEGDRTLRDYPAPLDTLPLFISEEFASQVDLEP
jgi:myogenesis-regulating glycosidase